MLFFALFAGFLGALCGYRLLTAEIAEMLQSSQRKTFQKPHLIHAREPTTSAG
jgi:hypothetical protein